MYLPSPNFVFTIPSVYDGTQLDCRIHLPRDLHASRWQKQGAIVAHPYASLGGCYDDPVVSFVGGELLQSGYVVGTFNFRYYTTPWGENSENAANMLCFRGAGGSEGRTSWTAKPELADYVSFYGFMLYYLHSLGVGGTSESARRETSEKLHLILGGYSYGSLVASHLPAIDVLVDLFENAPNSTTLGAIRQIARKVSDQTSEISQNQTRPLPMDASSPRDKEDGSKKSLQGTTISYLLISPLLPPISQFLTLFSKFSLDVGMETSAQGKQIPCPKPVDQMRAHSTLAIYGNEDTFTSAGKLRKWSDETTRMPGGRFESHEINGAGHFWHEDGVELQARKVLRDWLGRIR